MEFVLITSSFSKLCTSLENNKVLKKIKYKRIKVDSEDTKSLLKRNRITKIPILIIKHSDDETNKILGCDNIIRFVEHFTKLNTKIDSINDSLDYTNALPEDIDDYDLVIIGDKITKYPLTENVIKFKNNDQGLASIAAKLSGSKKKILIVSAKKNPLVQIVNALYLSLVENKEKEDVEEILGITLDQLNSSLTKIIAQYFE